MAIFDHTPHAWLYGYVQIRHPGYRTFTLDGTDRTIGPVYLPGTPIGGYLWPDFVGLVHAKLDTYNWNAEITAAGAVRIFKEPSHVDLSLAWPDRLGAVLGMGVEAGATEGVVGEVSSRAVPYAGIPLYGATWQEVDVRRSVEYRADRMGRERGYVYGGARLWRWRLTMSSYALTALMTGWCLRTPVVIRGAGGGGGTLTDPIGAANHTGQLSGWPLGIKALRWRDRLQTIAEVDLLVSGGAV